MFEIRIKVVLFLLAFALAIVVARLVDMQLVHADRYRQQAEDALLLPVKVLPAVRGRILDRLGNELASEEPCWDVRVDYGILAMDKAYLTSWIERLRRQGRYGAGLGSAEVEKRLRAEIAAMWQELADFSGESVATLRARAAAICARISAIRADVAAGRGFDTPIREERMRHPLVSGLDDQQQVAARELFGTYPWVSVEDSTRRVYHAGDSLAHVLGRMGPVTAAVLRHDPFAADDPRRAYDGNDSLGVTGVERAAEHILRGRRGRYQAARGGAVIEDTAPEAGRDVHLTIRRDLEDKLYALFARRSAALPDKPGGCIVVLDVRTRDCLALVSYPSYDPSAFQRDYAALRRDTGRQPLRFRAVANRYAPGSIVKPLACLAGLDAGAITLDTSFDCQGALFPDHPDRWRCWADQAGHRMHHGRVSVVEAIKHSCNVFMYHTGELTGVARLCNWFDMVGFGRTTGTGLAEEVEGINPTPEWLARNTDEAVTPGKARQFAIGQAEVSVTPLQAANLMAVYASGAFCPVTLVRELRDDRVWTLPGDPAYWEAIRRGMYAVVNDATGTAHRTAYVAPATGYALCGKTGSAQARPWPISYSIPYVDSNGTEGVAIVPATTRDDAMSDFVAAHPGAAFDFRDVRIHARLPLRALAPGRSHSHAWFAGFLQPCAADGTPDWTRAPRIAFAVMVEFGGSGGRVSAPVGKEVAETLIETLGPQLDPDAPPVEGQARR